MGSLYSKSNKQRLAHHTGCRRGVERRWWDSRLGKWWNNSNTKYTLSSSFTPHCFAHPAEVFPLILYSRGSNDLFETSKFLLGALWAFFAYLALPIIAAQLPTTVELQLPLWSIYQCFAHQKFVSKHIMIVGIRLVIFNKLGIRNSEVLTGIRSGLVCCGVPRQARGYIPT